MSEKNKVGTKPGIITRLCSDLSGGFRPGGQSAKLMLDVLACGKL
ncbi:MAG: hypothetical protein Q4E35_07915 [Eubacteriales bacterium]|nr:hypothetical protein [Eubacteriales bacterium]